MDKREFLQAAAVSMFVALEPESVEGYINNAEDVFNKIEACCKDSEPISTKTGGRDGIDPVRDTAIKNLANGYRMDTEVVESFSCALDEFGKWVKSLLKRNTIDTTEK